MNMQNYLPDDIKVKRRVNENAKQVLPTRQKDIRIVKNGKE